jgi:YVTN family beta-propeller protein
MKLKNLYLGLIAAAFLFTSCSNDDDSKNDVPLGAYDNGVFILNEGNFGTPNASVSYLSNDLVTFQNDIFSVVNTPTVLGDVAQSMSFSDDKAFIVVNASNEVEVVNRYTLKSLGTITENLKNPRYSVVLNDKLYVTNAVSKAVTVYDTKTYAYIATIAVNKTSEKIVTANGKLYVANAAYGSGSTVTVIDPATNTVTKTITLENGINSIEAKNGFVYVLSGTDTKSAISKINTTTDTATSIGSTAVKKAINMDIDGDKIYYTQATEVYAIDLNATTFSDKALLSVKDSSWSTFYGFGVIDGKIYSADANGFTADGTVTVYSSTGTLLKTLTVGKGPNGFYSNNN